MQALGPVVMRPSWWRISIPVLLLCIPMMGAVLYGILVQSWWMDVLEANAADAIWILAVILIVSAIIGIAVVQGASVRIMEHGVSAFAWRNRPIPFLSGFGRIYIPWRAAKWVGLNGLTIIIASDAGRVVINGYLFSDPAALCSYIRARISEASASVEAEGTKE